MSKIKVENISDTAKVQEETESDNEVQEQTVEPQKTKKTPPQKMVTCPNCNKEMLSKTFKYYHNLKCKPTQTEPTPVAVKPEKIEVTFDVGRQTTKGEKIQRLISRAF